MMRRRIIRVLLALFLCQMMLVAVGTAMAENGIIFGRPSVGVNVEEQLRAIESQYNAGIMPLSFTNGFIPWDKFSVTGLPDGVTEQDWKNACATQFSRGYQVDGQGVLASKFPSYGGYHFARVTVSDVDVVRAGILQSDITGQDVYYYMTLTHQTTSSGTPEVSATLLPVGETFVVHYAVNEYLLSYEIRMSDGSALPNGADPSAAEGSDAKKAYDDLMASVFGGTQPYSTTNGAVSFDVTIPYGYTAKVIWYYTVNGEEKSLDLTGKNVDDDHLVNEGYPLGTEPEYDREGGVIFAKSTGPSALRMSATFSAERVTENRRIVVELTKNTTTPVFDAHFWLETDFAKNRGSSGSGLTRSELDGNIVTADTWNWNTGGVLNRDPRKLTSEGDRNSYAKFWKPAGDGTWSLYWIFQTNAPDINYVLNGLELNGVDIDIPFRAKYRWENKQDVDNSDKVGSYETFATLADGAKVKLTFYREFNPNDRKVYRQRVYILEITGARSDITITGGNMMQYGTGAPEYIIPVVVGVSGNEGGSSTIGYYNRLTSSWSEQIRNEPQVNETSDKASRTDFANGDDTHYGANIRFMLMDGYENPVYMWTDAVNGILLDGNMDADGKQKPGSLIPWAEAVEQFEGTGGKLEANKIYGPAPDGYYYIRLSVGPGEGEHKMCVLNVSATAMKYMVRYMVGTSKDDKTTNIPDNKNNVSGMPSFNTADSVWDDAYEGDEKSLVDGEKIERYDDNYGFFYDIQNNARIAVSDAIPVDGTEKPYTKNFLYWVVVDRNENVLGRKSDNWNGTGSVDASGRMVDEEGYLVEYYKRGTGIPSSDNNGGWVDEEGRPVTKAGYLLSETRRVPYIVRPNTMLELEDYADFGIPLDDDLGGTAFNAYVIRLKAAWEDTPASFVYHVRMVYEDEEGTAHVLNFLQDVSTEWDESRINADGTLSVGVSPTDDIFVNWLNANPEYVFDEERNSTPTPADKVWEDYPTLRDPSDSNNSIDVNCRYRITGDNQYAVQNGGTILIYMIRRNGSIPVAKKIVGSPRGADTFTYTIEARLRPEDIAGADSLEHLTYMLPVGTYYGWPDLNTDTSVGVDDGYEQPGAPVTMQFARSLDGDPREWFSRATFTLEGGQAVILNVPQGNYTITETNVGVYDVFIDGGVQNVAANPTVTRTVKTGETARSVLFENHVQTGKIESAPKIAKSIVPLKEGGEILDGEFAFTLQPMADYGNKVELPDDLNRTITTTDGSGGASFDGITFNYAGVYRFLIAETAYDGETYLPVPDSHIWVLTVENRGGQLEVAKITIDETVHTTDLNDVTVLFTNKYITPTPDALMVVPQINKELIGRYLTAGEFSFELTTHDGETVTATNSASGVVRFDPIELTEEGDYQVTVREITDGDKPGIDYDNRIIGITYMVRRDDAGQLYLADTVYEDGIDTLTNTAFVEIEIPIRKAFDVSMRTGGSWGTDTFRATVELVSADGKVEFWAMGVDREEFAPIDVGMARGRDLNEANQEDEFRFRLYGEGTYVFNVQEALGMLPGVSYDGRSYLVTVTVTANGAELEARTSVTESGDPVEGVITFRNWYESGKITIPLKARKTLEGGTMTAHQFRFELLARKNENTDEYVVVSSGYNDAVGNVTFTEVFVAKGMYHFYLREDPGTDDRIEYDRTIYEVYAEVREEADGLVAEIRYVGPDGNPVAVPSFTNRMQDANRLIVTNTVIGGTDPEKEFTYTFVFTDEQGQRLTMKSFRYELSETASANGIMPLFAPESSALTGRVSSGQSIQLRNGQMVTVYLPAGIKYGYSVTESDHEPYLVDCNTVDDYDAGTRTASGTIDGKGSRQVNFINTLYTDVTITKTQALKGGEPTAEPLEVRAGDEVTYILTLVNRGNGAAYGVKVADMIPAGLVPGALNNGVADAEGRITWTIDELPGSGGEATISFTVTVPPVGEDTAWTNTATVTYQSQGATIERSSEAVVLRQLLSDVSITKTQALKGETPTADPLTVRAGDEVTYYLTVVNAGNAAASNITVTDVIPEGLTIGTISDGGLNAEGRITWTIGELAGNGGEATVSFTVTVPPVGETTTWTNTATAAWVTGGETLERSSGPVEIRQIAIPGVPDITITKTQALKGGTPTADPLTVRAGDEVTYYLTVVNAGDTPAANITVTDAIPAGLTPGTIGDGGLNVGGTVTWTIGELAGNGGEATVSFTVTVPSVEKDTLWTNTAAVAYEAGGETVERRSGQVELRQAVPTPTPTPVPTDAPTGSLTVIKQVTGNAGDPQAGFRFTVLLSDTGVNGPYGDMVFSGGVATFTLRHGQSVTASGLPVGIRYSVSEQSANQDGYATMATGETGIIAADATATAIFVNAKDVVDIPQTGDDSRLALWMTLAVLSLAGVIAAGRMGRRKRDIR